MVSGRPMDLYNTNQVRNWGIPISDDEVASETLHDMLEPLDGIDIDSFLPQETEEWCHQQLARTGFNWRLDDVDFARPFFQAYTFLR